MRTYTLDPKAKLPLYEQLYRALREDIVSGRLAGGERLPSKRQLAAHLHISQITVESAYGQLLAEGYLSARPRAGFYVERELVLPPPAAAPAAAPKAAPTPSAPAPRIDFKTNVVDTACFPFATWARLSRTVLSEYADRLLQSTEPAGALLLREQIAAYLLAFRGISVSPAQIVVGAGSEYLIHLLIHLLGRDCVFGLENPAYRKLYQIFTANDVDTCSLPLDADGLSLEALQKSAANAVYLTPSHQFPTGVVMPAARRTALLHWAREKQGRYLIEDDYDSEFRYASRPIPALRAQDEGVIYLGSFARSLAPSLRIGYLVLPEGLLHRYHTAFSLYSSTVPAFEQYTLAEFIRSGALERHINRARRLYQGRRDTLLQALSVAFADVPHHISGAEAGLHLLLSVDAPIAEQKWLENAASKGVRATGLSSYYRAPEQPPCATLLLGYAGLCEAELQEGAGLLRKALPY